MRLRVLSFLITIIPKCRNWCLLFVNILVFVLLLFNSVGLNFSLFYIVVLRFLTNTNYYAMVIGTQVIGIAIVNHLEVK